MWNKLRAYFRGPARKRRLRRAGHERLAKRVDGLLGFIAIDRADLQVLHRGEAAFLWESPPAASPEELTGLAGLAAEEMAPGPGRTIVSAVLYLTLPSDVDFRIIEEIDRALRRTIPEDVDLILGCSLGGTTGFWLATSESGKRRRRPV